MASDDVIDLERYREEARAGSGSGLSLLGAEGERRHFALPLWRMATASRARWAGLVRGSGGGEPPTVITALDLRPGGPREVPPKGLPDPPLRHPPYLVEVPDGRLVLAVGVVGGHSWYVVLGERGPRPLEPRRREDLLFLAGECSGLLAVLQED